MFLMYSRKKVWLKPKYKWVFTALLFVIGAFGLITSEKDNKELLIFHYHILIPFLYLLLDFFFKRLSYNLHGRDFYLYLRGSDEVDNSFFGKNPHLKATDVIFSFTLLIFIIFSIVFGYELFFGSISNL